MNEVGTSQRPQTGIWFIERQSEDEETDSPADATQNMPMLIQSRKDLMEGASTADTQHQSDKLTAETKEAGQKKTESKKPQRQQAGQVKDNGENVEDVDQILRAECAITAMAEFRNMSMLIKSKREVLEGTEDEHEKEKTRETKTHLALRRKLQSVKEFPHILESHSYGAPTYCSICDGLLVGLWSQGLRCKTCGMNVHRGEGVNCHDDCRAEALLTPCENLRASVLSARETNVTLREALKQVRQVAQNSPHFLNDIGQQINRDMKADAKRVIVATGVEEERTRRLGRFKARLVLFVQHVDAVEARGEVYIFLFLLRFQALAALALNFVSLTMFALVLWPTHGGLFSGKTIRLAGVHNATVIVLLYSLLFVLAFVLRRAARMFKRKARIIDQFLRDVLNIDAPLDFGISVDDAARRARAWSSHVLVSSAVTFVVNALLWNAMQPTSWDVSTLPPLSGMAVIAALLVASVISLSFV